MWTRWIQCNCVERILSSKEKNYITKKTNKNKLTDLGSHQKVMRVLRARPDAKCQIWNYYLFFFYIVRWIYWRLKTEHWPRYMLPHFSFLIHMRFRTLFSLFMIFFNGINCFVDEPRKCYNKKIVAEMVIEKILFLIEC